LRGWKRAELGRERSVLVPKLEARVEPLSAPVENSYRILPLAVANSGVSMEPGRSLLDLVAIKQDLEDLLHYPVDVVTENSLSPYIRDGVLAEARPLTG
jgi:hypothetical protein